MTKKGYFYTVEIETSDHVEIFKLTEDFLIENKLVRPRVLSDKEYELIKSSKEKEEILIKCIRKTAIKERSKKEIIKYLEINKCNQETIAFVLLKLEKNKHIDEKRFIKSFVNTQISKGNGPNFIKHKLRHENIENNFIDESLINYSEDNQINIIMKLVEKEIKRPLKTSKEELSNTLYKKLLQRGFSTYLVKQALEEKRNVISELDEHQAALHYITKRLKIIKQDTNKNYFIKSELRKKLYSDKTIQDILRLLQ